MGRGGVQRRNTQGTSSAARSDGEMLRVEAPPLSTGTHPHTGLSSPASSNLPARPPLPSPNETPPSRCLSSLHAEHARTHAQRDVQPHLVADNEVVVS